MIKKKVVEAPGDNKRKTLLLVASKKNDQVIWTVDQAMVGCTAWIIQLLTNILVGDSLKHSKVV